MFKRFILWPLFRRLVKPFSTYKPYSNRDSNPDQLQGKYEFRDRIVAYKWYDGMIQYKW